VIGPTMSLSLSLSTHTHTPSQVPSSPLCYLNNAGDALLGWFALRQLAAFGMPVACGWGVLAEVRGVCVCVCMCVRSCVRA
jgi:hypothetical protein